nr:uncharacterized protein LOC117993288 [Maniola hyperantus]
MNLTNLPPEIWTIVINYLDTKSKVSLYNTSLKVRGFFKPNVAKYVLDLNLSGVPDITAETLQLYMKNFENLITLDVTFTTIYLSDLEKICPKTLRNISINFFKCPTGCYMFREKWDCAKQVFIEHQFINVRFIVFDFKDSHFPLLFLNELPRIEHFEVDVIDTEKYFKRRYYYSFDDSEKLTNMNFSKLRYLFRNCDAGTLKKLLNIDFKQVEYIFMMYSKTIVVYVSPLFKHFFPQTCCYSPIVTVKVKNVPPNSVLIQDNAIFHAWHKSTNTFEEKFLKSILEDYIDCFPIYICMHYNMCKRNIINVSTNWYCLDECNGFEKILEHNPEKVTFTNYCRKYKVIRSVNLSKFNEWERIRNINYLRISNLYFEKDFILHLFINCKRIVTLDIYNCNPKINFRDYNMTLLSNAMEQACCLKNFKLNRCVDYSDLFEALSKCQSLENIYICDFDVRALDYIDVNPSKISLLLENCKNMYSLFIETDISPHTSRVLRSKIHEVAQRLELFHLFVDVNCSHKAIYPFDDVFNPSPLRIRD